MAGTNETLLLLRQTLQAQQPPTLHPSSDLSTPPLSKDSLSSATHIYYPSSSTALPLDTPTRFQRESITFTLREIYFAWLLQTESTADYIAKCQALGIHHLTFLEKADLSTWLEGGESSDYIGTATAFLD
jgi:parafibromin